MTSKPQTPFSFVLQTPAATPERANQHFSSKLSFETDASDVHVDLERKKEGFVVVDARSPAAFEDLHVPGALSLPSGRITQDSVALLRGKVAVVYCWGVGCNAATKAAVTLSALGIQVKEMIGGLEGWVQEGYPTEGGLPPDVSFDEYLRFHHSGQTGRFHRA